MTTQMLAKDEAESYAEWFAVLADATRVRLLHALSTSRSGAMRVGEIPNTGHLQRVVFNDKTEEIRRESLLTELRQRIRDVRQGPDGLLYLLTDENPGALLKIEPTQ